LEGERLDLEGIVLILVGSARGNSTCIGLLSLLRDFRSWWERESQRLLRGGKKVGIPTSGDGRDNDTGIRGERRSGTPSRKEGRYGGEYLEKHMRGGRWVVQAPGSFI